jgi:hypothetical protein
MDFPQNRPKRKKGSAEVALALAIGLFLGKPKIRGEAAKGLAKKDAGKPGAVPANEEGPTAAAQSVATNCKSTSRLSQRTPEIRDASPTFQPCLLPGVSAGRKMTGWRRVGIGAFSMAFHGAAFATVMAIGNSQSPANILPKYKIQILHLHIEDQTAAAGELWTALHRDSGAGTSRTRIMRTAGAISSDIERLVARAPTSGRAPQTLIVDNAPPELKLQQAVPAPMAVAVTLQLLPPKREEVQFVSPPDVAPEITRTPRINIVSLPDPVLQAQNVTVIPRVSQIAPANRPEPKGADPAAVKTPESKGTPAATLLSADSQTAGVQMSRAETGAAPGIKTAVGSRAAGKGENDGNDIAEAGPRAGGISSSPTIPGTTRIDLPPDSKPRTSVLGESAQMPGHIVATIYLRMGLPRNWILEYWASGAAASGLEAPWPYTMFRPNPVLPAVMDALLVRAHLTVEGRMEQLSLMTPTEWAPKASQGGTDKDTLFQALQEWRFRPASRNGEAVPVELLLVIPRQPE